jgi:hypothetical protein
MWLFPPVLVYRERLELINNNLEKRRLSPNYELRKIRDFQIPKADTHRDFIKFLFQLVLKNFLNKITVLKFFNPFCKITYTLVKLINL